MKLFLLREENYEGVDIFGLYSSREMAIESFPYQPYELNESHIEEIEVDPPNDTERYETFFCAVLRGTKFDDSEHDTRRMLPSEAHKPFPAIYWDENKKEGSCVAYGRTREEARQRAQDGLKMIHPVWQVGRYQSGGLAEHTHAHPSLVHKWHTLPCPTAYAVHENLETARNLLLEYERSGIVTEGIITP